MQNSDSVAKVYSDYYKAKGNARNDVFAPDVLFQLLAYEKCRIEAFRHVDRTARVVDIGGGGGSGIFSLLKFGFQPEQLSIVDIHPDRIAHARECLPEHVEVIEGDASRMEFFKDAAFDVVTSSTMFLQITDQNLARSIAQEMVRITKPGGTILIFDWRYDFWRKGYRACDTARMNDLFSIGRQTVFVQKIKGQLVPPLGRFLSKHLPALYFIMQALPFMTGLYCYVLTRK